MSNTFFEQELFSLVNIILNLSYTYRLPYIGTLHLIMVIIQAILNQSKPNEFKQS